MRMTYTKEEKEILRRIDKAIEKAIKIEKKYNKHDFEFVDYVVDAMRRTALSMLSIRDELVET